VSIPSSCKAAVLVEVGEPLEIIDVEVPDRLEHGAILVETAAATICATDVHKWDGSGGYSPVLPGPVILGHEMTGRVVRLGEGVTRDSVGQDLAIGDRIIWSHGFCGQCEACIVERQPTTCQNARHYMNDSCTDYPYLTGGFAEYCYVYPTSGRVKVPDEVSDAAASAAACALRTIVHAFDRLGRIDNRQAVVVQGTGPLGLFSVALASSSGSSNVIAVGGPSARLELAKRWGAHHTIDIAEVSDPADRLQAVRDLTGGHGSDVVIEVSGVPAAFTEGMGFLRSGGRYLIVGQTHAKTVPFCPSLIMTKHATLIGSRGASVEHYYRALEFMRVNASRFQWDDMISSSQPLADINTAMKGMQAWEEIKPAITFT
jgi:threonine dehydrogenase-like Zn-dependent dehydrogenase